MVPELQQPHLKNGSTKGTYLAAIETFITMMRINYIRRKITIHNGLDIVVARLKAREVARVLGFGTIDQARISLAAGELARTLANSIKGEGEIVISGTNTNGQIGIQVVGFHSNPPQNAESNEGASDSNSANSATPTAKAISDAL